MAKKAAAKSRSSAAGKRPSTRQPPAAKKRAAADAKRPAPSAKRPAAGAKPRAATKRPAAARTTAAASSERRRRAPVTLRLRSLSPVLTVNVLGRSITWYTDVLGFVVAERWESEGVLQGVRLQAGSCNFLLTQDDFRKGRDRPKGIGFRFYCETAQDIDALAARIQAAGGTLAQEPTDQPWGMRELAVTDPDGFQITIYRRL